MPIDEKTMEDACRMLGTTTLPADVAAVIVTAKRYKDKVSGGQPLSVDAVAAICAMYVPQAEEASEGEPAKEMDKAILNRVEELEGTLTVPELRAKYKEVIGKAPDGRMKENGLAQAIAIAEASK
jgi:hypothetical protein